MESAFSLLSPFKTGAPAILFEWYAFTSTDTLRVILSAVRGECRQRRRKEGVYHAVVTLNWILFEGTWIPVPVPAAG